MKTLGTRCTDQITTKVIKKSSREQATEWWNSISYGKRNSYSLKHLGYKAGITATEEMIEDIWRKETQQDIDFEEMRSRISQFEDEIDEMCTSHQQPQVDFEMLRLTITAISGNLTLTDTAKMNLQLFFNLLSRSSSFAHKAHKELNKLMK